MHQTNCVLLQRQVEGTRRLVMSRGSEAVCRHNRAYCKLVNPQMAGDRLGSAATALIGRRKRGKN
jgi:hypothetical protein